MERKLANRPFAEYPIRRLLWRLAWPVRGYMKYIPWPRGKGLLTRRILKPILPEESAIYMFQARDGSFLEVQYREVIGTSILIYGDFEPVERSYLQAITKAGATAIDAGANFGIFSTTLSKAVGASGTVLAFEPVSANIERLRRNLSLNSIQNVEVFEAALGDSDSQVAIHLAKDSAFHSTVDVAKGNGSDESVVVASRSIDSIWKELGSPAVATIKIDVEGGELTVLKGARQLLAVGNPTILLEASNDSRLAELRQFMTPLRYVLSQPKGFMPWNYVFSREVGTVGGVSDVG